MKTRGGLYGPKNCEGASTMVKNNDFTNINPHKAGEALHKPLMNYVFFISLY